MIHITKIGFLILEKYGNPKYPADSILRYREGDFNETVYIKIAACLDKANLMERGGTGFQTMIDSYQDCDEHLQPVVSIYPGFLNLRLYDRLYEEKELEMEDDLLSDSKELIVEILKKEGPKLVRDLQSRTKYKSRSQFLAEVLKPLMDEDIIYRDGNPKSPTALIKIKQ
ncbi:MAG: hypothetical protein IJ794_07185 [Lachnospiraceae bacterium]|nr:hypothetical protein [Lachnospiraceae bacterium]